MSPRKIKVKIFLISFLILFLELSLIRFLPAQVYYLGYYSNFILIASFVGMGMGLLLPDRGGRWSRIFPWSLLLLIAIGSLLTVSINPNQGGEIHFTSTPASGLVLPEVVGIPLFFVLISITFMFLSQPLGQLFNELSPLSAYTSNILGSLAGIFVFTIAAWWEMNPVVWFVISLGLFLLTTTNDPRWLIISGSVSTIVIVLVILSSWQSFWSPYQKITVNKVDKNSNRGQNTFVYFFWANNIGHQFIFTRYEDFDDFYRQPYELFNNPRYPRVLVIGSGTGNDVALALKYGASHVDAVEIDPVFIRLGKQLNPLKPYDDPRVRVFIDDGRSFLEKNKDKYDLILFALTDSLVLASGNNTVRLESFLFTKEALTAAKEHLTSNGLLALYNDYRKEWLLAKLSGTLEDIFQQPSYTISDKGWGGYRAYVMNGDKLIDIKDISRSQEFEFQPPVATDDWPFPYLEKRALSMNYLTMLLIITAFTYLSLSLIIGKSIHRDIEPSYFFLGAAFMLLETRSLIQFSLLFGNTWLVNSLVFFALLTLVLVAIWMSARLRLLHLQPWYLALFVFLAFQYVFPLQSLLHLTPVTKYVLVSLITLIPVFFANVIFSATFKQSKENALNFASNVLGAAMGGVLEYLSLLTGYRHLLLLIIFFYLMAFIFPGLKKRSLGHRIL